MFSLSLSIVVVLVWGSVFGGACVWGAWVGWGVFLDAVASGCAPFWGVFLVVGWLGVVSGWDATGGVVSGWDAAGGVVSGGVTTGAVNGTGGILLIFSACALALSAELQSFAQ